MDGAESLRQEIAELRQHIEEMEDFANGILRALSTVLPYILRSHPKADEVAGRLRRSSERYDELLVHPELTENGEMVGLYEAEKMLYRGMALLGVWPDTGSLPQSGREHHQAS